MGKKWDFWGECVKRASIQASKFANNWQAFIGVPAASAIGAYVTSTQGSQPSTGQPILDAALAAFIAFLLTWIVVFLLGMSRTPSQLFYEQMGRANTLEERLRPKIKVLGLTNSSIAPVRSIVFSTWRYRMPRTRNCIIA